MNLAHLPHRVCSSDSVCSWRQSAHSESVGEGTMRESSTVGRRLIQLQWTLHWHYRYTVQSCINTSLNYVHVLHVHVPSIFHCFRVNIHILCNVHVHCRWNTLYMYIYTMYMYMFTVYSIWHSTHCRCIQVWVGYTEHSQLNANAPTELGILDSSILLLNTQSESPTHKVLVGMH